MEQWLWDKINNEERKDLASYVIFSKYSDAVNGFIEKAHASDHFASSFDYHITQDKRRKLVEKIYNALCQHKLEYDLNEDNFFSNNQQIISKPEEILNKKHKGTCLDLAILFCAICCHYDLLPILILLDGHALAAVSLTHRRREWENSDRQEEELFRKGFGSLTDAAKLRRMVKREEYLAVECTGFAISETLDNPNFPRENGFWSFDQAIKLGSNQLEDKQENKKFIFALDIQIAYYLWWDKLGRERLEKTIPKILTNNSKDLLKDIYVPLGLIERKPDAERRQKKDSVAPEKSNFNQHDKDEVVKEFVDGEFFNEVLKHRKSSKSQGKRLVIVGDPGGGKSTLLQKIADWVITEKQGLPIWISLAQFDKESVEDQNVDDKGWLYRYLSQRWLRDASTEPEKTPQILQQIFQEEIIKSGQLWLMLDGADEMAVSYSLKEIKEQLDKGWADSIRVVLSCRLNLWELQKDSLKKFDVYRTLDFNYPEQVHQFINNWFGKDNPDVKKLQDKLKEENWERLRDLIKNPLRLALLCRIWNEGLGELPDTKAGFYQLLVDNHYKWKDDANQEFDIPSEIQNKLNMTLGELARNAIDDENFRFRLRENFIINYLGSPTQEDSLFWWALKLGWLLHIGYPTEGENNRQEKVYAFFHPSFQEYFAATVDKTYDFFLREEHKDRPIKDKCYRIFDPQWREVILLWLGRTDLRKEQKEKFIQRLVDFKDGCGKFYRYRAYLLAAAGIAEFTECDDQLANEIVKQIVTWGFGNFDSKKGQWVTFPDDFANEASRTLQQTQRTKAIDALEQLLSNNYLDDSTRWQAAESLGKIDPGNQKAINALVQPLSNNDLGEATHERAAYSLGKIGTGNQTAINALEQLLSNKDLDNSTRRRAAESLGKINTGNQTAINALEQLLSNKDLDNSTRRRAAESLGKIDPGNQKAINALVQLVSNKDLDDCTRRRAAESLGKIGTGNQTAINAFVQLLSYNDLDNSARWQAAESLGKIGTGNQTAINAFVQRLFNKDLDDCTRRRVAESLGKIGTGNQTAIDALEQLLSYNDLDNSTRRQAAESLGKIETGNQTAIHALVQLLSYNDLDNSTRRQAAESLGKIGTGNQTAIHALVQLLSNKDLHNSTRRQAAESLEKIGTGNQTAIHALVQLLSNKDLDNSTHRQAAESLGKIGTGNQTAIHALVQLLSNKDLHNSTRWQAAESLGKIGTGNQTAIDALEQLLSNKDLHNSTRWQAAESLGKIGTGNQTAIDALEQLLSYNDLDNSTRWQAAESLGKIETGNQTAIHALVQLLSNKDLHNSTRRQAAESLEKIGTGNQTAIHALVQLLSNNDLDNSTRRQAAESLEKIGTGNQTAIHALVQLLSNNDLDNSTRRRAAESLEKIGTGNESALDVVAASKDYFNDSQEFSNEYLFNVIWRCSENILYPKFYQAWHQGSRTNRATQNLDMANLPQILEKEIDKDPNLCNKVKLICIDGSKFIDFDNPAVDIYGQMLDQKCSERENGEPDTMPKFKLYWNSLRRKTNKTLVLVFYENPNRTQPQVFSESFLNALNTFDGAICLITEQDTDNFSLETFDPNSTLVKDVLNWIQRQIDPNCN